MQYRSYDPKGSGLLKGSGGPFCFKKRQSDEHWSTLRLSDATRIKREVPDFEEGVEYTERELLLLAEKILLCDPKHYNEHPVYFPLGKYLEKLKHEIYPTNGVAHAEIVSGIYWRTHPQGRRVREDGNVEKSYYL